MNSLPNPAAATLLPGFVALPSLWQGPGALFASEQSARWHIRTLRVDLAKAEAMAMLSNRMYVHLERFASVVSAHAIAKAKRSAGVVG